MKPRAWIAVAILAVAVAVLGIYLGQRSRPDVDEEVEAPAAVAPDEDAVLEVGALYFPGTDGRLHLHEQDLPTGEPRVRAAVLLETLLEGPGGAVDGTLRPPLPDGTRLEGVHLLDGTAYVDLRSEVHATPPSTGSLDELLTVYSVVNTLALGVEGVDRVVILWNGSQPATFGGHLDTTRPLAPDTGWVAGS